MDGTAMAEVARTLVRLRLDRRKRRVVLLMECDDRGEWSARPAIAGECSMDDLRWVKQKTLSEMGHLARYHNKRSSVSAA